MLNAYRAKAGKLERLAPDESLDQALWLDLYQPMPAEVDLVAGFGLEVPTLADMEEIEISNRLYREVGVNYMTVVLPGHSEAKEPISSPVCFILSHARLITLRHHVPRPFETFPERADKAAAGCDSPEKLFLGLYEEIIGRLADLLEGAGRGLEEVYRQVYQAGDQRNAPATLQSALEKVGRESELVARIRLSLLTLERALGFNAVGLADKKNEPNLRAVTKGLQRDISALEVHCDYLATRIAQATDSTLGMINLLQNGTVRIVSVVAVLFLPPTLIASVYGMNFRMMPELGATWGYPAALALMVLSAAASYIYFRWKKWL